MCAYVNLIDTLTSVSLEMSESDQIFEITWALVEFTDRKKNNDVYVTPIENFRNFSPKFANDFQRNKEYDIKWGDSFDNNSGKHDGYFKAKILLLGGKFQFTKVRLVCRLLAAASHAFVCCS